MPDILPIIERLKLTAVDLRRTAEAVSAERWQDAPGAGRWSAAEVICHLTSVEDRVLAGADKALRKGPVDVPLWKRLHPPIAIIERRIPRAKSPVPLEPHLLGGKLEMLNNYAARRVRSLALLEQTKDQDLSKHYWRHPLLGMLNFYEWFRMVAHHEVRHTKQIREIVDFFQKSAK